MLELRAVRAQAGLWHGQGRTAEARARLSRMLDWFTEGLETADVVAGRELLTQLGATPTDAGAPSGMH